MTDEEAREPADEREFRAGAVTVAYVHQNEVTYSWHHSMTEMVGWDLVNHGRIMAGGYIAMRCGSDGLVEARNKAVRHFLEDKPSEWLFWIDTDMGFEPNTVDRLLAAADPVERPMVGGLCFSMRETTADTTGGWRTAPTPTVFDWAKIDTEQGEQMGFAVRWDYPSDTLVRCAGTGSACILIHRSVFEAIEQAHGRVWYDRVPNTSTGQLISEDLSFCLRAGALGLPLYVHTGIRTTHMKPSWVAEEDYWQARMFSSALTNVAKPATETQQTWTVPRYAIIPSRNRPARLLALVSSLGTQCDEIVVLDNGSDPPVQVDKLEMAAGKATVRVFRDEEQPPNLARFWNIMFDHCADQAGEYDHDVWDVAVLNDDSVVSAGWFDACATGLRDPDTTAVIAHTSPTTPRLLTELHNDPNNRMCPHAFVIRGETGMRADESMMWWYFDSDLDQCARQSGGVLSVDGPRVINALANTTTTGANAEQAQRDAQTFAKKWANR